MYTLLGQQLYQVLLLLRKEVKIYQKTPQHLFYNILSLFQIRDIVHKHLLFYYKVSEHRKSDLCQNC